MQPYLGSPLSAALPLRLSLYLKLSMPEGGMWLRLRIQAIYLRLKLQIFSSPGMYLGRLVDLSEFKIPHLPERK